MILIIDDDVALARMMALTLDKRGYQTCVCHSGEAGIEHAERDHPDLILLDLHLPGLDGWGVLDQLRGAPQTSHVPVVVVSSERLRRTEVAAHGLSDYLAKPFAMGDLVRIVQGVLDHRLPASS